MGQPQKACSIVSPMRPIQKCGPETRKISAVGDVDAL